MLLGEILRRLVLRGSDGLVQALYDQVRSDPAAGFASFPNDRPAGGRPELADQAMAEGLLTSREANLLRAMVSRVDAPVPAAPASLHALSASQREAS